jgi:hypothetical protein
VSKLSTLLLTTCVSLSSAFAADFREALPGATRIPTGATTVMPLLPMAPAFTAASGGGAGSGARVVRTDTMMPAPAFAAPAVDRRYNEYGFAAGGGGEGSSREALPSVAAMRGFSFSTAVPTGPAASGAPAMRGLSTPADMSAAHAASAAAFAAGGGEGSSREALPSAVSSREALPGVVSCDTGGTPAPAAAATSGYPRTPASALKASISRSTLTASLLTGSVRRP